MPKELRAGISWSGNAASAVLIELNKTGAELLAIEEITRSNEMRFWFLGALELFDKKLLGRVRRINVAMDMAAIQVHSFPMDSGLPQAEQNAQAAWELSNYILNFRLSDQILELKTLRTNARDQVMDVVCTATKKSAVLDLTAEFVARKWELGTVEMNQFAAETAMFASLPELREQECLLLGFSTGRTDAGIFSRGRLMAYRYQSALGNDELTAWANELRKEYHVSAIYAFGTDLNFERQKALRAVPRVPFMALNPFRKIRVSPSAGNFSKFVGREHRFAACVGAAIKTTD
jgi:hypothetical protein